MWELTSILNILQKVHSLVFRRAGRQFVDGQLPSHLRVKQLTLCKLDSDVSKSPPIFVLVPLRKNSNFVRVKYEVPRQWPTGLCVTCLHRPVFNAEV